MVPSRIFALLAAVCLCSCAHYAGGPAAKLELPSSATASLEPLPSRGCRAGAERGHDGERTLTSGGRTRRFILRVPPGGALKKPAPLVFNLHGFYQPAPLQE